MKDTTSRNTLSKFDTLISKKFEKQLELKEEELRKLEELQDLFDFLDDIIPEDDGELIDPGPKKRGRKRSVIFHSRSRRDADSGWAGGRQVLLVRPLMIRRNPMRVPAINPKLKSEYPRQLF